MGDCQWTALPFGLRCSPYWTDRLTQVVERTLCRQGVHLIWYVKYILIFGESQTSVSTNLGILLLIRNEAGLIVIKKVPINSESTGELSRPTDQSECPDGEPAACKIEQGAGNDEGLPAEEEIITGSYRCDGWDFAGPAEGHCGTAWPGEVHYEGSCLDAAWGSVLEGLHPILSETGLAAEGGIGSPQKSGPAPHSSTPSSQGDPLDRCEPGEPGGLEEGGGTSIEFYHPSHTIRDPCTSH